jgi:hypothetical protein
LKAILLMDPKDFVLAVAVEQMKFYKAIVEKRPASQEFLAGWLVRANCSLYTPCKTCLWKGRKPLVD